MKCHVCQRELEPQASENLKLGCSHRSLHEEIRQLKALDAARQKIVPSRGVVMVRSLISHRNQKPRIDIQVGEIHTQMDTDSALDVAKNIIECAMGSYADGFIFNFVTDKLGLDPTGGAIVIQEFRDYREKLAEEFRQLQSGGENK